MEILFIRAKRMYRYIDRSKAFKKAEITLKQKNWEPSDPSSDWEPTLPDSGLYWNTDDNTMYDASTRKPIEETKGLITNADEANMFRDKWFEGSSTVDSQGNVLQAGKVIPPNENPQDYIYTNNLKNEDLNTNPLLNDPSFVNENGVRSFSAVPFKNIVQFIKQNPRILKTEYELDLDNESEKEKFKQAKDQVRKENAANAANAANASNATDATGAQDSGGYLSYNVFLGLSVLGGFFALDHLYLRSPLTFLAKIIINIMFFWRLVDI